MALTLVKEDGSGKPDANSYADVADGDAYFAGHLYPLLWDTSAVDRKGEALVMATRVIDSLYRFNGWRVSEEQALQWPRVRCPDPDRAPAVGSVVLLRQDSWVPSDVVPRAVVDATCELARELLITDRTAAPPGEGISSTWTGIDGTKYDKSDTRPIISLVAQAMLGRFGSLVSRRSGVVKLVRA